MRCLYDRFSEKLEGLESMKEGWGVKSPGPHSRFQTQLELTQKPAVYLRIACERILILIDLMPTTIFRTEPLKTPVLLSL